MPYQAASLDPGQIVDPREERIRDLRETRRDSGLFLRVGELHSRVRAVAGVLLCGRVACGGLDGQVACATCSENLELAVFPKEKT